MPPETTGDFHGNGPSPIDLKMLPSSDVYSLAIVAHQLLTGSLLPVTSGAVSANCDVFFSWWESQILVRGGVRHPMKAFFGSTES